MNNKDRARMPFRVLAALVFGLVLWLTTNMFKRAMTEQNFTELLNFSSLVILLFGIAAGYVALTGKNPLDRKVIEK